ncbi:hypothetical protein FHX08_001227 [Rhizobium sp. BK529]|nr:hypothetical protein [Rhizobium sp. BK529]
MAPSQSKLAEALNTLIAGRNAAVTETPAGIAVNELDGPDADRLYTLFEEAGWTGITAEDQAGSIPRHLIAGNGKGLTITASRPAIPEGIEAILTRSGFEALLDRPPASAIVWIEGLSDVIDTRSVRYCPWWHEGEFQPQAGAESVAKVNRLLGRKGPGDHLGRWLLKAAATPVHQAAIEPWRLRAASRLLRAMAQEIEPDNRLLFKGPPPTRFTVGDEEDLTADLFATLQSVATWLLENERELENRHGLLAAEIARTATRGGSAMDLASTLRLALEGARIAYNFGVTQQNKDTLRALGDLRKAVSEDTAKLSEIMRTLGTAVAGAVFANIGLIVARTTLQTNAKFVGPAAMLVGIVLAIYVLSVIGSGVHYIWVQTYLRNEWRGSLYKFLSDDDYKRLVEVPVRRAETAFWGVAAAGILMMVISLVALFKIASA